MNEQDNTLDSEDYPVRAGEPFLPAQYIPFVSTSQTPKEYQEYVLSHIQRYDKQSSITKIIHNGLQLTIFVGAALVTIVIGIPSIPKLVPTIISGVVTLATVIANYYKFGERSRDLYRTAEALALEYNWFNTERGPYKNKKPKEALELLMNRTETIIRNQAKRSFALEKLKEDRKL